MMMGEKIVLRRFFERRRIILDGVDGVLRAAVSGKFASFMFTKFRGIIPFCSFSISD